MCVYNRPNTLSKCDLLQSLHTLDAFSQSICLYMGVFNDL